MESNRVAYLQQREFAEWKCFLPFFLSRLLIFFSYFGIRSFYRLFLSLFLAFLSSFFFFFFFFTSARFLRAPLPRELALRAILTHICNIKKPRGVLVKSSVSILENAKKRWVESRGCGFPPHFHAKTPDSKPPKERMKLALRFTVLRSPLCLSYSISSIVPWQSSARIIRRIGS